MHQNLIMKDIRSLTQEELKEMIVEGGEKAFRAKQIYEWLWKKHARSFDEMTNLSKDLRNWLNENFEFPVVQVEKEQASKDRTIKMVFRLSDDALVEGVLIPSGDRVTACISSQVGCKFNCDFCATGKMGFGRNLNAAEIVDQVAIIKRRAKEEYDLELSNIVLMGMGEPLLNYDEVMKAIHRITSPEGMEMSPQRITLSTVGIPKMIKKLADDGAKFQLAVSLHSASDKIRSKIMPVNRRNDLSQLKEALIYYNEKTGNRISFEYLLMRDINDSLEDAKELAEYCKSFPVKINLIEFNSTDSKYQKSTQDATDAFITFLKSKNMVVNLRRSRGEDIDAACGQLAGKTHRKN